jgi:hypothetical protein
MRAGVIGPTVQDPRPFGFGTPLVKIVHDRRAGDERPSGENLKCKPRTNDLNFLLGKELVKRGYEWRKQYAVADAVASHVAND